MPMPTLPAESMRRRSDPFVAIVRTFAPVALKASVPALVTLGVVTDVEAESVVNAPVLGVVAPTVPLNAEAVIVLLLSASVPASVASVPVVGRVSAVLPVAVKLCVNAPACVTFPASVIVLEFATPVPPLAAGKMPVTPVVRGRPVALVSTAADGVPRFGVVRLGLVANTSAPEPVSSLITPASSAEVVAAKAESLSVVTTKVLEAGTVVPLSVVVLEDERLVKAPEDGFAAPIAVFVRPTAE